MSLCCQRKNKFPSEDAREIKSRCADLIENGKINEDRVRSCLKGSKLLEKFSFSQLRSRITYQRK